MIKRLFDILFSLALLLPVSPVLVLVAVAIKLDSKGPVIYTQIRVGRATQTFKMYKFRSMAVDADQIGGHSTLVDDPRITKIGAFLRKTSLDELPQLLNVLLGDMSFVGPRPDVPAQRNEYSAEEWIKRHKVRPGITGLAQAKLRSLATGSERKALDLAYVDNVSLLLDLKILCMTLGQIVGKGTN